MKKLLVLTNEFPYGTWEPYMESEEKYYSSFNKVWIASLQLRNEHKNKKRDLLSQPFIIPVDYKTRLFYFLNAITVLTDIELYKEIRLLLKSKRCSFRKIVDLFVFLSRAHHEARVINKALQNESKDDFLIYSYRFEYQPYVAIILKKKWKKPLFIVSRAHRYDLYEEEHNSNYIPLRQSILNNLDYVFPCSVHGVKYIKSKYKQSRARVECKYLGTLKYGVHKLSQQVDVFRIVSCSNVVKVKRIDDIVKALADIDDINIEWVHYGDGPLLKDIKKLAGDILGDNVKAFFPGNIANKQLLEIYSKNDYHVFINVSASEGVPVSIMEAMSYGIPCIATDVGGTSEIVNFQNGKLIGANPSVEQIKEAILSLAEMDSISYTALRRNAVHWWEQNFNAETNYRNFINEMMDYYPLTNNTRKTKP